MRSSACCVAVLVPLLMCACAAPADARQSTGAAQPPAGVATAAKPPASAPAGSCKTCHAGMVKQKVVHAPAADDCSTCHNQQGTAHKFTAAAEGADLCTTCHEVAKPTDKWVHGPVAAGDCVSCHDPHGSANAKLVRNEGPVLCESCHIEMKAKLARQRFTHAPVQSRCVACHDPHASPNRYQLRAQGSRLCVGCHDAIQKKAASAPIKHDALTTGRECLNCHDPHAADLRPQLRAATMPLCLGCHDRELAAPSGPIANIKAWLAANPDAHGPIQQQDCTGCHRPHESDHFRLLGQDYPPQFYSPFDPVNYALCFGCHEPDLVRVEQTTTLTGFRDGNRNLHFLHVNRPDKGRTCRACHEVHSSKNPKHIRDTVPFGAWQLPVKYQKTESGGKCAPGCHLPKEYRRAADTSANGAPKQ